MAILCPLSADQLTAAGPPIWSMLAVWYELVPSRSGARAASGSVVSHEGDVAVGGYGRRPLAQLLLCF
jgi:hypothetical protein